MFDLQALAFASDITRVFAFKLGRDASNRAFPESGYKGAFHSASHHQEKEERILDFAKINKYHVSMIPYFLEKLKNTPDGDGNLLDNSVVLYGSPMGDSNVHNHKRVPMFLAGHAGGALKGNLHIKAADGTPMANAMLAMAQKLDLDIPSFGDSTAAMDLNRAGAGGDGQGVTIRRNRRDRKARREKRSCGLGVSAVSSVREDHEADANAPISVRSARWRCRRCCTRRRRRRSPTRRWRATGTPCARC